MTEAEPVRLASSTPDRPRLTHEERHALRLSIDERTRARLGVGPGAFAEHDLEAVTALLAERGEASAAEIEATLRLPTGRTRGAIKRLRLAGKGEQVRRYRWRLTGTA